MPRCLDLLETNKRRGGSTKSPALLSARFRKSLQTTVLIRRREAGTVFWFEKFLRFSRWKGKFLFGIVDHSSRL